MTKVPSAETGLLAPCLTPYLGSRLVGSLITWAAVSSTLLMEFHEWALSS